MIAEGSGSTHHILQKTYGTVMLKEQCAIYGNWSLSNFNDGHICVVEPTTGACNVSLLWHVTNFNNGQFVFYHITSRLGVK